MVGNGKATVVVKEVGVAEGVYKVLRVPYRFAVGTVSGAVGWGVYLSTPVLAYLGYEYFANIQRYSSGYYDTIRRDYVPQLPTSTDIAVRKDAFCQSVSGWADQAYKYVISIRYINNLGAPGSLFDQDTEGAASIINVPGALTVSKAELEKHVGPLQQYVLAAKIVGGAFVVHKMGLFDTASFVSKQAELTVESWFGVYDDAYGLFDLPYIIGGVYKAAVATVSKVFYTAGFVGGSAASLVGPAFFMSTGKYIKSDDKSGYFNHLKTDISGNMAYYAAASLVPVALNLQGTVDLAQTAGKGFELAFEHACGLSGDNPGLLDADFYS